MNSDKVNQHLVYQLEVQQHTYSYFCVFISYISLNDHQHSCSNVTPENVSMVNAGKASYDKYFIYDIETKASGEKIVDGYCILGIIVMI